MTDSASGGPAAPQAAGEGRGFGPSGPSRRRSGGRGSLPESRGDCSYVGSNHPGLAPKPGCLDERSEMPEIKLPRGSWTVDESAPLGPAGGFGQVFAGTDGSLHPLAIKRLFLDTGALGHRELNIADALIGRALDHIVPVLDAGVDADSGRIFVVMARAERSLRDELTTRGARP